MASARLGCLRDCSSSTECLPTVWDDVFSLNQSSVRETETGTTSQVWRLGPPTMCQEREKPVWAGTGFTCDHTWPCVICLWPEDETALFV